ncbi:RHS repeat domain-containing protein [Mucilaginibacter lappiensis]|uniref:YD repeat-containing protein n=1 Tax=Mucilaginibacter lappiensis TaxID=354630 RepID=A0A841J563_9SPHI|nr:hypothetical protein [Mucilaginibacter lappiensis]MBB6126349.1 hypothetical protein [Mucilaginibacter lappiensis]
MRSSIKYLCLTFFFIVIYQILPKIAEAQTITPPPVYVPNVIPSSPQAAALMKFVDVPVSPYTGTADISVPIYTIHAKGLDIPISLGYHTGGIRLGEEASSVGLGWALNAGGVISRTINDKDDLGGMYFGSDVPQLQGDLSDNQPSKCGSPITQSYKYLFIFFGSYNVNFLTGPGNTTTGGDYYNPFSSLGPNQPYDLEPDTYSFNFLGMGGKFIIKRDKSIVLEKQDNIKIELLNTTPNIANMTFLITDDKGNRYYFSQTQSVVPNPSSGATPSSWFLTQIITQQNDKITFNYGGTGVTSVQGTRSQTYRPYLSSPSDQFIDNTAPGSTYSNIVLQNIDYTSGQVVFNSDYNRNDLSGADKLNSISIYSKTTAGLKLLKSHNLYYSYFTASGPQGGTTETNRLRLDSVQEVSGGQTIKPYKFVYNFDNNSSNPLAGKHSFSIDHWGYYNRAPNTVLIPTTSAYYNDQINAPGQVNYSGATRDPDILGTQYFSLQKITYPTGGSSVLNYEANTYNYQRSLSAGQEYLPQTVMHFDTTIHPGVTSSGTIDVSKIYPYVEPGVQGSNLDINITFRAANGSAGWPQQDLNTTTLRYTVDGDQTSISSATCQDDKCSIRSRFYQRAIGQVASRSPIPWSFYYDPSVIPQSDIGDAILRFSFNILKNTPATNPVIAAGGLRISSITDYSADGVVAKKRSWSYGLPNGDTNGLLMASPSYVRQELVLVDRGGLAGNAALPQLVLFSSSNTPITSTVSGNIVGYSKVSETIVDPANGNDNGKIVYSYSNVPDSIIAYNGYRFPGMNNVGHTLNGSLLQKITYSNKGGGTYFKVSETDNFFHTVNRKAYYSAKYQSSVLHNPISNCGSNTIPNAGMAVFFPSIISERILQDSIREITYDQLDTTRFAINSNKSFYDNPVHYQVTRSVTTDSKGNKIVDKVTYPQDYIVSGGLTNNTILDNLISRNMLATTIEKRDSIYYPGSSSGLVTGAMLTLFKQTGTTGTMLPDKMYKLDVINPVSNFQGMTISGNTINQDSRYRQLISFDGYDQFGNPTQYTQTDQLPVSIIFDYKRASAIAQVKNADSLSIAYTSFEADGTGHWTVASATRDNTTAITGTASYNLSNGAVSKTGLTAATTYVVSYWTKNGAPFAITGTVSGFPVQGATINGWTYYEHRVTGQTTITLSGTGNIDELRLYPVGALMTSYTYDPLVGVTSSNDSKNEISYYEYDNFQRLMNIKDKDGNIVKHMDYHYQGQ